MEFINNINGFIAQQTGITAMLINLVIIFAKVYIVFFVAIMHMAYATYFERKTIGHMQVRLGPMRVGPHGILQPFADVLKLMFKEDIIPAASDKTIFYLSPIIPIIATISSFSVIPFFKDFAVANINVGLLYLFAMSSLGAYGLIMSGWSSNSKYSFLGGLRASSQVISYEIAMGLSLVGVVMMAGSLNLSDIVKAQQAYPLKVFIIPQILGFVVFLIAAYAETNRTPFDLPEAESELVAGHFTEYSGMRFTLFFISEYMGMLIMSLVFAVCYLGGWNGPFDVPFLPFFWLLLKVYAFMFLYYWVRATVPRYRYDQLMDLGWKVLIPLALLNIVITGLIKTFM